MQQKSRSKVMLALDNFEFFQASLEMLMPYHCNSLSLCYLKNDGILHFNLNEASIAQKCCI